MSDVPDVRFLKELATACFYILAGQADPVFPGSTVAAPSRNVLVVRSASGGDLIRAGDKSLFDLEVDWVYWQEAVVPVLNDPRFNLTNPINQDRARLENGSLFIRDIEFALVESFREQGFLPPPVP